VVGLAGERQGVPPHDVVAVVERPALEREAWAVMQTFLAVMMSTILHPLLPVSGRRCCKMARCLLQSI
jgi:hypothetical protein